MEKSHVVLWVLIGAIFFVLPVLDSGKCYAHCDGLDGPVIIAAKKALETENINLVLIWVQKKDESTDQKGVSENTGREKTEPRGQGTCRHEFL